MDRSQSAGLELGPGARNSTDLLAVYGSIIDQLPSFIVCKDAQGKITFVNQRFADMMGMEPTWLLGKSDAEIFPRELAEKYRAEDLFVMHNGVVTGEVSAGFTVPRRSARYGPEEPHGT